MATKISCPFQIGHILIKVDNLKEAVEDYEALGFRVTYGSVPGKSTNAMVYFEDGSFLELFSTNFGQPVNSIMGFMVKCMHALKNIYAGRMNKYILPGEGFRDYALDSAEGKEFRSNLGMLENQGLSIFGPKHMKRKNAEGILLQWSLCYTPQEHLPFFMSPYSPSEAMTTLKTNHLNGVSGLAELVITTKNWAEDLEYYQKIYCQAPAIESSSDGLKCRFQLKNTIVTLEEGKTDGIRKVLLKSSKAVEEVGDQRLDSKLCHEATLILVSSYEY